MHSKTIAILIALSLCVASCSVFAPEPTATPTQTATSTPTETPLPTATFTPKPTSTPKPPTSTPTPKLLSALVSSMTPVSDWNGVPIMPNAITGSGDDKGYSYTVNAEPGDVRAFYESALAAKGYSLFATGEGASGETVMMIFMKGSDMITVSIIPSDGLIIVLIV